MMERTINQYMERVTATENCGNKRLYYIGDRFLVIVSTYAPDPKIMGCFKRHGYIKEIPSMAFAVHTYYTDESGKCWERYNITLNPSDDGKHQVINPYFLREATPENERELVAECIHLAVEAGAIE